MSKLSEAEIEEYRIKLKNLSNRAQYKKAYVLAASLMKKYPKVMWFARYEAVMTAEGNERKYPLAAKKLRKLLMRTRGVEPILRRSLKNEYYWFSRQPYKQYKLGLQGNGHPDRAFRRVSYYSQGVGSAMIAKNYALKGNKKRAIHWAKISEKAWERFFKVDPNWHNSYYFYAMALAYQNRLKEADKALETAAKIAKKPKNWSEIVQEKKAIRKVSQLIFR